MQFRFTMINYILSDDMNFGVKPMKNPKTNFYFFPPHTFAAGRFCKCHLHTKQILVIVSSSLYIANRARNFAARRFGRVILKTTANPRPVGRSVGEVQGGAPGEKCNAVNPRNGQRERARSVIIY